MFSCSMVDRVWATWTASRSTAGANGRKSGCTQQLVSVLPESSSGLFTPSLVHKPRTMTKEWQEATNEYLKVSHLFAILNVHGYTIGETYNGH